MFFTATLKKYRFLRQHGELKKLRIKYGSAFLGAFALLSKHPKIDTTNFMGLPITPLARLEETQEEIKTRMELMILRVQSEICKALEQEDACTKFVTEKWHQSDGGGINCILQDGKVFEKAVVNIFVVSGTAIPVHLAGSQHFTKISKFDQFPYFSAGICGVVHPKNPMVPAMHFSYQYCEHRNTHGVKWWFGGGTDLIPFYVSRADALHFHSLLKEVCDKHHPSYYSKFKKWCDDYYFIPHRGERRGFGGIFFEGLEGPSPEACFKFVADCADTVIPSYAPLVGRHKHAMYTKVEREWQLLRRGRFVEFMLICNEGTAFGLFCPKAKHDSTFMTLPLIARWEYMQQDPSRMSPEGEVLEILKNPKDWTEECSCEEHEMK